MQKLFAITLRTILILLLSNLGKRVLEKSLVRKKTKRFKHRKISFFTLERNWTKLINLKRGDKQEFRRFEAEQEAARIMVFE